jgi:hypothetical protein
MNLILERSRIMAIDYANESSWQDAFKIPGPKQVLFAPPLWLIALVIGAVLAVLMPDSTREIFHSINAWGFGYFLLGLLFLSVGTGVYFWQVASRIVLIINAIILVIDLMAGLTTWGAIWVALPPLGMMTAFQFALFLYGLKNKPWQAVTNNQMNVLCKLVIQTGVFFMLAPMLISIFGLASPV